MLIDKCLSGSGREYSKAGRDYGKYLKRGIILGQAHHHIGRGESLRDFMRIE
jgi:hypothetical protein